MNMETVRKQGEHSLIKIQMLIDELRSKGTNEEVLDELQIESARAIDDIIRLIEDAERQKKVHVRIFARFIEAPFETKKGPKYGRVAAIRVEIKKVARKIEGSYVVSWAHKHPLNIIGQCMTGKVTKENTYLSAIIAMVTAASEMKIRGLYLYAEDDKIAEHVSKGTVSAPTYNKRLATEIKRIKDKNNIAIQVIREDFLMKIEQQYGRIRHPSNEPIIM